MNSSFEALGLSEALVRAVTDLGYTTPTPVQLQAIPVVLSGGDLMAGAQTGTGKTAAFVLPILQRLGAAGHAPRGPRAPRVLILAPTRELAAQVEESVRDYGKHVHATCAVIFGGVSIRPQFDALKRGVDIVVATPGRLLDHVGQKTIDLSKIEVLVLDEADRMLDMGFLPDMKRVFAQLPKQRQTLLFSATFSDEIRTLAATLLRNPTSVQATPRNTTVEAVDQKCISVERTGKSALLAHPQRRQLLGLVLAEPGGVLRGHQKVITPQGEGEVTSGTFSPTLNRSIALARIPLGVYPGALVQVTVRDKQLAAKVVRPPFVRNGKILIN